MSSRKRKTKHGYAARPVIQPVPPADAAPEIEEVVAGEDVPTEPTGYGIDYVPLSEAIARGVMRGEISKQALERYLSAVEEDRALAEERAAVSASRFAKLSAAMLGLGLVIACANIISLFRDPQIQPVIVQTPRPVEPIPTAAAPVPAPVLPAIAPPIAPPPAASPAPETVPRPPSIVETPPPPVPRAPKRRISPRVIAPKPSLARALAVRNHAADSTIEPDPDMEIAERW